MRFDLYTEKTVSQCLSALNARMQAKSGMDGWVEKKGAFAIAITSPVIGKFQRRTTLHGNLEKRDNYTVVHVNVSGGADRRGIIMMVGAVILISLGLIGSGNVMLALPLLPIAAYLYIPMRGDHENSEVLIGDLQRTLKAKNTPPKKQVGEGSKTRMKG